MNNKITFCENCRKDVSFTAKENPASHSFKGEDVEFIETIALCDECNNEVWLGDIHDNNLKALYDAYRLKNNIISLEPV